MSSTDNILKLDTARLASATGTANATAVASAPALVTPPPPEGTSLLDQAATGVETAITAMLQATAARDTAAVAKQAGCLNEAPGVLIAQDHQGAEAMTTASATIPEFPILTVVPGADAGQVRTV